MSAWYFEGSVPSRMNFWDWLDLVNTTAHPTAQQIVQLELLNFRGDLARIREAKRVEAAHFRADWGIGWRIRE